MQSKFESYLKDNFPYLLKERCIICCSGGVDSIVLFHLIVLNKCDQVNQENFQFKSAINISAKSGEGIDNLLEVISSKVKQNFIKQSTTVPTKTRYILGVQKTVQSLLNAKNVNLISQTELIVEELRLAINEIGRLTGAVDVEEYLEVIFRDFCIGK